jgi:Sec-independent protein secretion pathway component TatC
MLTFFHVGILEITLFAVTCLLLVAVGVRARFVWRWLPPVAILLAISAICTPADPLSMILIAAPLLVTFFAGVLLAPRLVQPAGRT